MLYTFVICFIAGIGAGLGTGFAGMSAAAVISPMLITFLHMEPYMAVGIALASDVLASAVSAYGYPQRSCYDDIRTYLHTCWQLCIESGSGNSNGRILHLYDTAAWN